jgi:hypothetical protein
MNEGDSDSFIAYYALHKFHWKPTMLLNMSREEKAFILAAIQIKADHEKEERKKINAKKPRKR